MAKTLTEHLKHQERSMSPQMAKLVKIFTKTAPMFGESGGRCVCREYPEETKDRKHKTLKQAPERLGKDLFKACMFASKMVKDGVAPGLANYKAGQYYGYSASDVGYGRNQLKQVNNTYD